MHDAVRVSRPLDRAPEHSLGRSTFLNRGANGHRFLGSFSGPRACATFLVSHCQAASAPPGKCCRSARSQRSALGTSLPGTPPTTTAVGHIERCNVTHHAPVIPPHVSTTSESGADWFSEA